MSPPSPLDLFLEKMNEDLKNEWTHLKYYLYHASAVTGLHACEYKEFLTEAAEGELKHVQQFMDRLWGMNFPQPQQNNHAFPVYQRIEDILLGAVELETQVVENYAKRLTQLDELATFMPTESAYLKVFYEDQLQDSYEDAEKMKRMLRGIARVVPRVRSDMV